MDLKQVNAIENEEVLDDYLSIPRQSLIEMMKTLKDDILILGVAGKIGVTLARTAKRAIEAAGVTKKIYGVDLFLDEEVKAKLDGWGIETIKCDLMDPDAVKTLPQIPNVIYMAGRKFGTGGSEEMTWAMNAIVPAYVGGHFTKSRIVVFSTGCVYPLVPVESCGCTEDEAPNPVGEYAQSCLGRERVFGHFSKVNGTPMVLFRLNYAVDLRYGVLYDIASKIWADEPVHASVQHFNVVWQGDVNNYALLSLDMCESPASILNLTGPETIPLAHIANLFGKLMNKEVTYTGTPGNIGYLNNSAKAHKLYGYPEVSLDQMLTWQADWIMKGGKSLGKPTHFEVNDGKF